MPNYLSAATPTTEEPQSIPGLRHRPPSPQVQEIPRNPSPAEFEIEQSISWKADLNLLLPPTDYSILNFNAEHTHTHDAESGMGQLDGLKMNPYAAGSVYDDLDLASPAKSLSSLAGSHIESAEGDGMQRRTGWTSCTMTLSSTCKGI